ncbi:MAG TPA: helix-hairpin-helix domain-containing protein [Gemmatimonadales bacterium]|nr:helix-hairpin-helix domain-containing protein [Gemmatimonadales bacterium]
MEPAERRAILLLLLLGVAGQGIRLLAGRPGAPPGEVALMPAERRGSPTAHRDSALVAARPLAPGETIDPDQASLQDLLRLPRVGPGLARAILADRGAKGPFRDLQGLDRVPGIGPKLLGVLEPYLRFRGGPGGVVGGGAARPDLNAMTAAELEALPGIGPALAARIVAYRESHGHFADIGALGAVPGIGPALLARLRPLLNGP